MKLDKDMLFVVADGTHMLLLRNEGSIRHPELRMVEHCEHRVAAARDMLTGPWPSVGAPVRPARDTIAGPDPHRQAEDRFLCSVADRLDTWASRAKGFVVAAPSRALGTLRRHYSAAVRARLVAEIDKNFAGHPIEEIQRLIAAYEPPDRPGAPATPLPD